MPVRNASAQWNGSVQDGSGTMRLGRGAYEGPFSFKSRMQDGAGTNPEELIAAAHASCFTMATSFALAKAGHSDGTLETDCAVTLVQDGAGFTVSKSALTLVARVPGISEEEFARLADEAKANCPISKLLNCEITLDRRLES